MFFIFGFSKTFSPNSQFERHVLNGLDLELRDGEFVTIIGSNGAGKSTLFNAICGSILPDSGTITLNGRDITLMPEHKRAKFIGRVFQDPRMGTASDMWLEENLAIANRRGKFRGLNWAISGKERKEFKEMLTKLDLGLENRLTTKVGLLSGGQRQAVTLLMAVMNQPKLLLLDQHTAALDPKTAKNVLELSDKFIEENHLTALMVTHNMRDAIAHGNRLIMMNEGRIILDVSGEEKKNLTVEELLAEFAKLSGSEFANDRALLAN